MSEDSATVEVGPAGVKAALKGFDTQHIFLIILIVACSAFIWWSEEKHIVESATRHAAEMTLIAAVVANQAKILESGVTQTKTTAEAIQEASEVQAYVLTLSQQQREMLRLTMPHSLRDRTRRQ